MAQQKLFIIKIDQLVDVNSVQHPWSIVDLDFGQTETKETSLSSYRTDNKCVSQNLS